MSTNARPSRASNPPSRPTTPIRPSSRTSLRSPHPPAGSSDISPLAALEPAFAEFADSMADLEANMMHLQLLHESLARFGENFASFLYGLNMNAFCVDFGEGPGEESWRRAREREGASEGAEKSPMKPLGGGTGVGTFDAEGTFMTTDTSFVENPPQSTRTGSKFTTPASSTTAAQKRQTVPQSRPSGIARGGAASTRGSTRGSSNVAAGGRGGPVVRGTRASGLARASAVARGRGRGQ